MQLSDQAEIVIVISANDIDKNKYVAILGSPMTKMYSVLWMSFQAVACMWEAYASHSTPARKVPISSKNRLEKLGIRVYKLYLIPGYPSNTSFIVSDEGYGKNDYIETTRPLVVITAPGPGSGKMATCLSQLYHEYKRGVKSRLCKI